MTQVVLDLKYVEKIFKKKRRSCCSFVTLHVLVGTAHSLPEHLHAASWLRGASEARRRLCGRLGRAPAGNGAAPHPVHTARRPPAGSPESWFSWEAVPPPCSLEFSTSCGFSAALAPPGRTCWQHTCAGVERAACCLVACAGWGHGAEFWGAICLQWRQQAALGQGAAGGRVWRGGLSASVTHLLLSPESSTSDSRRCPTSSLAISTSDWTPSPWWR